MNRHYLAMNTGDPVLQASADTFSHVWNAHQDVRVVRRFLLTYDESANLRADYVQEIQCRVMR